MKLRTVLFWTHLVTGLTVGLVVLMMSATGVVLTYEMQLNQWARRHLRAQPAEGAVPQTLPQIVAEARAQRQDFSFSSVKVVSDPLEPMLLGRGRREQFYVDRYSGEDLGDGKTLMRTGLNVVMYVHRWFALPEDHRRLGKAITGASSLAFLFLLLSGFYLWFPRSLSAIRRVVWFRRGLGTKARHFNWHNVIGFWSAIPLAIIVVGALFISWPGGVVRRLLGDGSTQQSSSEQRELPNLAQISQAEPKILRVAAFTPVTAESDVVKRTPESDAVFVQDVLARASSEYPSWTILTAQLPDEPGEPARVTVDLGNGRQYHKRETLSFDMTSGDLVARDTFADMAPAIQWRRWARFAHTGEHYGVIGQTIAGIASFGAIFLVYTSLSLSYRRFFGTKKA